MSRITPVLALCAILPSFSLPTSAQVVTDHLVGKYATTKEYCADAATQDRAAMREWYARALAQSEAFSVRWAPVARAAIRS